MDRVESMATDHVDLEAIIDEFVSEPLEATGGPSVMAEADSIEEAMQTEELGVDNENTENQASKTRTAKSKVCELPLSKIKGIMKMDPEVVMVGSEAVFAVAKAAELFLQTLAKQSFKHTAAQKKKTVQRSHVDSAVTGSDGLFFLEDALD